MDGEKAAALFGVGVRDGASRRGLSAFQLLALLVLGVGLALLCLRSPSLLFLIGAVTFQLGFALSALWRLLLVAAARPIAPPVSRPKRWPRYSVLVALHDEAEVMPQLVSALSRIDYPANRLEGFLILESHDRKTLAAAKGVDRPDWLRILVVPPGRPRTKPRALNWALAHSTGELVTVYDAEDRPDPGQLKEAASRFAEDADARLACLQAPLRIRRLAPTRSPFFDRHFALEYAAQFEVMLPGLARLGLPFPLGGTSNHFRAAALRQVGGWDAHNVTEDADLGFRLWSHGWRLGVISRPTLETPPGPLYDWLPQRTRWIKGFMQTWGVHTRRPWGLGLKGMISFVMTLGMAIVAAAAHGPSMAWVTSGLMIAAAAGTAPPVPITALIVLASGAGCAWLATAIGARRAGLPYDPRAMLESPAYWSVLSFAFLHAVWRLITEPFAWDKTRHFPDAVPDAGPDRAPKPISAA